ncbi:MAG TPA: hypothetical protein VE397_12530 [Stellaceae bacterium]|nr:hypothetical protein [Stellaceae bacterium]
MTATRALIDTLKRRASDMAQPFIDAGQQPNATEMERAFGEAAQLILRDAEARAQLLPREEFEHRVEAFKAWHQRHEAKVKREIGRLFERGFRNQRKSPISEARRRATAELDHREAEFHQWVESYALTAWIRATEDLLTLDRPSAFISSQESPARH